MQMNLSEGIYPPVPTFFTDQEELDLDTLHIHVQRLLSTGIAGYVVMGSNGEAVHLDEGERASLISTVGEFLEPRVLPLIAGCGAQSTRMTIKYCQQAARYGAHFALVLPPSYYPGRMNQSALLTHYRRVADESPLPVVLYNMPASAAGLDLDAESISLLSEHANIVGVKDSSGNVAKLALIVARAQAGFRVFTGSAATLFPALTVGAVGAVSALANVFPDAVCRLQELVQQQKFAEARVLQAHLIPVNAAVTSVYGVAGLKQALQDVAGYGGVPRGPLLPLTELESTRLREVLATFRQQIADQTHA